MCPNADLTALHVSFKCTRAPNQAAQASQAPPLTRGVQGVSTLPDPLPGGIPGALLLLAVPLENQRDRTGPCCPVRFAEVSLAPSRAIAPRGALRPRPPLASLMPPARPTPAVFQLSSGRHKPAGSVFLPPLAHVRATVFKTLQTDAAGEGGPASRQ